MFRTMICDCCGLRRRDPIGTGYCPAKVDAIAMTAEIKGILSACLAKACFSFSLVPWWVFVVMVA